MSERLLEHKGEAQSSHPAPQRPRQTVWEGQEKKKKKGLHIECIASFPGQRNITQRHLTEPAVPPVRKENKWDNHDSLSIVGCTVATPTLISHQRDSKGTCRVQLLGIWLWEVGRGLPRSWQTNSYPQCLKSNPTSCFCSHTEQSQCCTFTRKLGGREFAALPDLNPQTRSLLALELDLPMPREDAEAQPHPPWKVSLTPIWPHSWCKSGSNAAQQHSS